MWGSTVSVDEGGGGGGAYDNPVGLSMFDGLIETVKYIWVNI